MKTATIKFKANGKNYTVTMPWRGVEQHAKDIRAIYKKHGVKKATCQMVTLSTWGFWCGYTI